MKMKKNTHLGYHKKIWLGVKMSLKISEEVKKEKKNRNESKIG